MGNENEGLVLKDVTIRYDTERELDPAVHSVAFRAQPGEKVVLLGPSGCGKSTLLKAIGGFLPVARGSIHLDGKPTSRPGPNRMMVFQEFDQLFPWMTALRNVTFAIRTTRKTGDHGDVEDEARRFLRLVGLEGFEGSYPHTLSGGMKQRVAIARALAVDPDVLLMDEPFGSLDAQTRVSLQNELNQIWERAKKTIIFVTHSLEEAIFLGQTIIVLSSHPGTVSKIVSNPHHGHRSHTDLEAAALKRDLDSQLIKTPSPAS